MQGRVWPSSLLWVITPRQSSLLGKDATWERHHLYYWPKTPLVGLAIEVRNNWTGLLILQLLHPCFNPQHTCNGNRMKILQSWLWRDCNCGWIRRKSTFYLSVLNRITEKECKGEDAWGCCVQLGDTLLWWTEVIQDATGVLEGNTLLQWYKMIQCSVMFW